MLGFLALASVVLAARPWGGEIEAEAAPALARLSAPATPIVWPQGALIQPLRPARVALARRAPPPLAETPAEPIAVAAVAAFYTPLPPTRPIELASLQIGEPRLGMIDAPAPPIRPREFAALPATPQAAAPAPEPSAVASLSPVTVTAPPQRREDGDFRIGAAAFVRIFKKEGELELWLRRDGRYSLYRTYPVCKWSGRLGPKLRSGDYQSPEGFYSVSARQLNPHSAYHRAFDIGFPNAFDRQNGRTGGALMVHGACKSVGCFAMTDKVIEEIYGFVEAALRGGQREVPVHIFPFRMTDQAFAHETEGDWTSLWSAPAEHQRWTSFWSNLKEGYELFERSGEPPLAYACGSRYAFGAAGGSCSRIAGW